MKYVLSVICGFLAIARSPERAQSHDEVGQLLSSPGCIQTILNQDTRVDAPDCLIKAAALDAREESITCVLNYRKDGSHFTNVLTKDSTPRTKFSASCLADFSKILKDSWIADTATGDCITQVIWLFKSVSLI